MADRAELACVYSALILADKGVEISSDNINKILKAAKVSVDTLWLNLFTKALKSADVKELVKCSSSAAPVAAPVATTTTQAAPEAAKPAKEEKKEESEDEDDGDMGFGLFD